MTLRKRDDIGNYKRKEALDRSLWRTRFERGYGLVARQKTK